MQALACPQVTPLMDVPAPTYRVSGPQIGGCLLAALGISLLAGWILNLGSVLSVFPGQISMKVNTALGFLCAGLALLVVTRARQTQRSRMIASALAIMVIAVGLLTLIEYLFHCNLGINQLFVPDHTQLVYPGR